ncbi:hypothetical protein ACFWP2_13610 [Kitasatospora sp. NPDC058444]|uniref:hypothetical protein n=1 Tax=Kitasatospora sp. NPDC058444 TaxID=3346504 RepID=UPI00365351E6
MRANHATKPQEPAPRGVAGARRGITRWLPRPRIVAAAGALLAQLWGVGAPGAYAATTDPPPDPARPAVRRALHGVPALDRPGLDGPALDGQSAERPVGSGPSAGRPPKDGPPDRSPGPAGDEPGGNGPGGGITEGAGATGAVGDTLQERIRAGGLPLPGQRAAVPDAFALASGLLDVVPAQARSDSSRSDSSRSDGSRAFREGGPVGPPSADRRRTDAALPAVPRQRGAAEEPLVQEAAATTADDTGPTADPDRPTDSTTPTAPGHGRTPATVAIADTATTSHDGSATATAVLAPIAAGLLLTGAAMCKHRGLPRGH